MEQQTGSKQEKEYIKAVYCHPAYLTYMQSSVQLLSSVQLFVTLGTAAHQASLSITNSRSPPKAMSIESVMLSNHLILCCPLLLLPSIFPSIRVFSNESALCFRWPKYWSFSFMQNARLDEAQTGIKIAGRNISNLRYTDDTTLMAESLELKSLLKGKEESKRVGIKLNIQKTKIMAYGPVTSWQ